MKFDIHFWQKNEFLIGISRHITMDDAGDWESIELGFLFFSFEFKWPIKQSSQK